MQNTIKTVAISTLGGLVLGLLLGFVPEHSANSKLQDQIASITQSKSDVQNQLNLSQARLQLSSFAVRAADVSSQAEANNYSVASTGASSLFTDLRKYVDQSPNGQVKQQLQEVLSARDRTIAGLAQADPAVKTLLQQVFMKLESASASANGAS